MVRVIRHSNEGSTWKEHKYVAIINGRYIYPEDLKSGSNSSYNTGNVSPASSNTSGSPANSSGSGGNSSSAPVDSANIIKVDKGSVKSYRFLPKNPEIGDMYLLENTKVKVFWNGSTWEPVNEKKKKKGGGIGGGSREEAIGTVGSNFTPIRLPEGRQLIPYSASVSTARSSGSYEAGRSIIRTIASSARKFATSTVSSIRNSNLYKAGSSFISRIFGRG